MGQMARVSALLAWAACLLCSGGVARAQPFIFYRGIFNAASYAPQALPNGSIAQGSVFAILGRNFGPTQASRVQSFPLGTTFQNVGVSVCQSGSCIPALPLYVSARQVNAIMPSNAPLGPVSIRVVFNGQGGYYASATVVASSFGIAAVNGGGVNLMDSYESLLEDWRDVLAASRAANSALTQGGFGPGTIQNVTTAGSTINSPAIPARPGQKVTLWGTGLGAGLNDDNLAPQTGNLPVNVEIWVGGRPVTSIHYSGRSACCAGIDQLVFDLPDDTPLGCYVPVQVRTGEVVSNSVSIAVSADGSDCSDPANPLSERLRTGGRLGLILANRVSAVLNFRSSQPEETVDFGMATFRREIGRPFAYNAAFSLPPPGTCTVHSISGDLLGGAVIPGFRGSGVELDAGARLDIAGRELGKVANGAAYYTGTLAGTPAGFRQPRLPQSALEEAFAIRGSGGADIGPFQVEMPAPPAIRWLNRREGDMVDRSQGFTVTWETDDTAATVLIAGVNSNIPGNASALFLCTASSSAGSFAVPPYILQALPPSPDRAFLGHSFGYVMVGALRLDSPAVPVSGLDWMMPAVTSWSASAVRFQ